MRQVFPVMPRCCSRRIVGRRQAEHTLRMQCHHQFLVRWYDPGGDGTAHPADARTVRGIRLLVELYSQPTRIAADSLPDSHGTLADTSGEHQRIHPAQIGSERAQFISDAVHEQIHRLGGTGIVARQQLAHITGDP